MNAKETLEYAKGQRGLQKVADLGHLSARNLLLRG
jgi:hypothetical protein